MTVYLFFCICFFFFYDSALIQLFVILRSLETNIQPPPFAAHDEERFQLEGISVNTPTHTHTNTCKHRQEQDHRDESDSRGKSLAELSGPKLMRNNRILQARATASYYYCQEQRSSKHMKPHNADALYVLSLLASLKAGCALLSFSPFVTPALVSCR